MKTVAKIAGRAAAAVVLALYVVVAVLNYSVVQSYVGTVAGGYFSREWGGEIKIGALHAMPWDHLILHDVLMVDPGGDTLLDVETLRVSFKRFPFRGEGLELERVYLKNGYYHFASMEVEGRRLPVTNLQYIIDYYTHGEVPAAPSGGVFTVDVKRLTINNLHYKMDLPDKRLVVYEEGVEIPHMEFYGISGVIKDILVRNDDVRCKVVRLRTRERSGFEVEKIAGDVHVSPHEIRTHGLDVRTAKSHIMLEVDMEYDGWEEMEDYLSTVRHAVEIKEGTTVAMSDVAYWAPVLWGIEAQMEAEGFVEGTINDLQSDVDVRWGKASGLQIAGRLQGIEHPESARGDVEIERLWTNSEDVAELVGSEGMAGDGWPSVVCRWAKEVGHVDVRGSVHGGVQEATTVNLHVGSGIGALRADVSARPIGKRGMGFDVEVGSDGIGLKMLESEWVSRMGFALSTHGEWRDMRRRETLTAEVEGALMNGVVRGQQLAPVSIAGEVRSGTGSVEVQSTDSLALATVTAAFDLRDSIKRLSGKIDVEHVDLAAFGLAEEKFGTLRTNGTVDVSGVDVNTMEGTATLEGTTLGEVDIKHIKVDVEAHEGLKNIRLKSDPVDVTVSGQFGYEDLPIVGQRLCQEVLPEDMIDSWQLAVERKPGADDIEDCRLNFHLHWKDDGRLLHKVDETLTVARDTRIDGSYNTSELLKMVMRSDSLRMGAVVLENVGLSSHAAGEDYVVEAEAQSVNVGEMELAQRANVSLNSNRRRALAGLTWGREGSTSRGDLLLRMKEGVIKVLKPDFYIGETAWQMGIDSLKVDFSEGLQARGEGIRLHSEHQAVEGRLQLAGRDNDYVELRFDHFGLGGLTDILLQETPISVAGNIDGRFTLSGLNETPYFNANLTVDSCHINRQSMGDVRLRSNWNAELNMLNLELSGDQIEAMGWVELGREEQEMNFNVGFDRFDLGLAAPLMRDFASRFEGLLHGNFDITGTLRKPVIIGEALVENGALGIDMTGVTYFFSDSIRFNNKHIRLDGFELRDPRDNVATLDGEIRYDGLEDIELDLQLRTDNLLVLDRPQGDNFHGTLLAAAEGHVGGRLDSLEIDINARTNAGSRLTVPVSDQRQVKAQNYISFVGDERSDQVERKTKERSQHLGLELDLAITPDVQLNLPMDLSDVTVKVGASGSGDLHMTLAGEEMPQVMGSYEITSGTMKLGIMSLIEKNFTIESGSSLGFQGNLPDARFDLKAVYSQRVNLSTLTGGLSDVSGTQKYVQVEDVIAIAGTLQEPTIGFDIRLPNVDASVEEEVFAYIDRNSERDMLNQTISLLVLGQFYNANTSALNGNIATSGGTGALSGLLSDLVGVVDINVDYKAANEVTRDQLDVNISKDWGRWYLESTLGYGGESQELESSSANSAVIDALVGYRISPLVHLFAYNRTNTNDYTRLDLPYKQGVGLKLTKDFNRWSELFMRKKKKGAKKP